MWKQWDIKYNEELKETIGFALNTIFWIYAITAWIQINNLIFITNNYWNFIREKAHVYPSAFWEIFIKIQLYLSF